MHLFHHFIIKKITECFWLFNIIKNKMVLENFKFRLLLDFYK